MIIKFKRTSDDVKRPEQAYDGDAGFDLYVHTRTWNGDYDAWIYGTGVCVEIPKGYVGLLFPRSSVRKTRSIQANCVGVIDSGYRGEIQATFYNLEDSKAYAIGEKCCQLVIVPVPEVEYEEVDELTPSERGNKGHGSSGKY